MLLALLALAPTVAPIGVPRAVKPAERRLLHGFRDVTAWRHNPDGGSAPTLSADAGGMRLVYRNGASGWGNVAAACRVPPTARALLVTLTKVRAQSGAAMHVWLWEADQDAWVAPITADGVPLGQWKAGMRTVRIPVSRFGFEPRGARSRDMVSVDRMLIGSNYADLEVVMNTMEWELADDAGSAALPVSSDINLHPGDRGLVGVLDMGDGLPGGFVPAHSPSALAAVLINRGYGAPLLKPGDLLANGLLSERKLRALVLPYGPFFPAALREPFLAFLKQGGGFLTLGGYAFDRLVDWNGSGWVDTGSGITAEQMATANEAPRSMNTRFGRPGDAMTFDPEQIGLFDPTFHLSDAQHSRPTEWLSMIWPNAASRVDCPLDQPAEGYAASGLIGDNNPVFPPVYRRWVPMLDYTDHKGRRRGSGLSLMRNHSGPFAGSTWAFSGVTDRKVVLGATGPEKLLSLAIDACCGSMWLRGIAAEMPAYSPGETAKLQVRVRNDSNAPQQGVIAVFAEGRAVSSTRVRVEPRSGVMVTMGFAIDDALPPIVRLKATLTVGITVTDAVTGGLVVRKPAVVASGPRVAWQGNYLTVDGEPHILLGANQTGFMFFSDHEDPVVWDGDFERMSVNNIRILRILHFSPFAKDGYKGQSAHTSLDLANRPERLCRQMDAIIQLAMKRRILVMLTLHDWLSVGLTDEELQAQADWNAFWAARYRDVPGILFDVQNEPSVDAPDQPHIVALWNDWLAERYGGQAALAAAWHVSPPEADLPNVPLKGGTDRWDDVRTADRKRFETVLLNRWLKANVDGIKRGNPNAPVCVGYLPSMSPADKALGVRHTDFSNMHYYGDLRTMPLEFKLTDRRAYGKGLSLGEFGAQEAHQARNGGADGAPEAESRRRFVWTVSHMVGLGGAFAAAWCWKELDEMVFPWGLWHRGTPVARPWFRTYASMATFLRYFEPAYERPSVYLLLPDAHRTGPGFDAIHAGLQRSVELLLSQHVNFGVLNEWNLSAVPEGARAIFWPMPYCPSDRVFEVVARWVVAGGTLYTSGALGFDTARKPTQAARYTMLGLAKRQDVGPFETPEEVWGAQPEEALAGRGRVLFAPYPLELRPRDTDEALYAVALHRAGVRPNTVRVDAGSVRCLTIADRHGGWLTMLARTDDLDRSVLVRLPGLTEGFQMPAGSCAFVLYSSEGRVSAIQIDGVNQAWP